MTKRKPTTDGPKTPFEIDMLAAQSMVTDARAHINVNGTDMPRALYNLIISRRDLSLYSKGLKPHRHWKITPVKKYFGLKGSAEKCLAQIEELVAIYVGTNE